MPQESPRSPWQTWPTVPPAGRLAVLGSRKPTPPEGSRALGRTSGHLQRQPGQHTGLLPSQPERPGGPGQGHLGRIVVVERLSTTARAYADASLTIGRRAGVQGQLALRRPGQNLGREDHHPDRMLVVGGSGWPAPPAGSALV